MPESYIQEIVPFNAIWSPGQVIRMEFHDRDEFMTLGPPTGLNGASFVTAPHTTDARSRTVFTSTPQFATPGFHIADVDSSRVFFERTRDVALVNMRAGHRVNTSVLGRQISNFRGNPSVGNQVASIRGVSGT